MRYPIFVLSLLIATLLSGCGFFGGSKSVNKTRVNILDAGLLLARDGQAELGLTLANTSAETLWINAHFQTPDAATDCVLAKELSAAAEHLFICPQTNVQAGVNYPIQIDIFSSLEQDQPIDTLVTSLRFSQEDIANIKTNHP